MLIFVFNHAYTVFIQKMIILDRIQKLIICMMQEGSIKIYNITEPPSQIDSAIYIYIYRVKVKVVHGSI